MSQDDGDETDVRADGDSHGLVARLTALAGSDLTVTPGVSAQFDPLADLLTFTPYEWVPGVIAGLKSPPEVTAPPMYVERRADLLALVFQFINLGLTPDGETTVWRSGGSGASRSRTPSSSSISRRRVSSKRRCREMRTRRWLSRLSLRVRSPARVGWSSVSRPSSAKCLSSGITVGAVRQSLEEHLAYLAEQIGRTEELIRTHINSHPTLKRQSQLLASVPGIAETTAALLLAEMTDINRYRSARQVAAYAGLVPRERQSGTSVRGRTRLSKIGNARLRRALYFPAITALRCSPFFQAWAEGMQKRGKCKMSVICAVMDVVQPAYSRRRKQPTRHLHAVAVGSQ